MFTLAHNAYKYVRKRRDKSLSVVVLGLNNAGKTTLKNTIDGIIESTAPTMGFSKPVEVVAGRFQMKLMDLGGGKVIRRIWKEYLPEVHAIIFVIDAADNGRFPEAREALESVLGDDYSKGKPVLLLANKQDLPTAATAAALSEQLDLVSTAAGRSHNIIACKALLVPGEAPDDRIVAGLRWLGGAVAAGGYRALNRRVAADAAAWRAAAEEEKKAQRERAKAAREARARKREEEAAAAEAAAAEAAAQERVKGEGAALLSQGEEESTSARYEEARVAPEASGNGAEASGNCGEAAPSPRSSHRKTTSAAEPNDNDRSFGFQSLEDIPSKIGKAHTPTELQQTPEAAPHLRAPPLLGAHNPGAITPSGITVCNPTFVSDSPSATALAGALMPGALPSPSPTKA